MLNGLVVWLMQASSNHMTYVWWIHLRRLQKFRHFEFPLSKKFYKFHQYMTSSPHLFSYSLERWTVIYHLILIFFLIRSKARAASSFHLPSSTLLITLVTYATTGLSTTQSGARERADATTILYCSPTDEGIDGEWFHSPYNVYKILWFFVWQSGWVGETMGVIGLVVDTLQQGQHIPMICALLLLWIRGNW